MVRIFSVVVALGVGCAAETALFPGWDLTNGPPVATADTKTTAPTKGKLIVGILKIESSYGQDLERPSRGVPDTVQFWIGPQGLWRIRTYAIDHDLHPHNLGDGGQAKDNPTEFARGHIARSYGDVLSSIVVLEFSNARDAAETRRVLEEHKLAGKLEVAGTDFAFWNPDAATYRTKTTPK